MHTTNGDHRLIWRNTSDKINRKLTFQTFARGKPKFDKAAKNVNSGMPLTFQHGARIIFWAQGESQYVATKIQAMNRMRLLCVWGWNWGCGLNLASVAYPLKTFA